MITASNKTSLEKRLGISPLARRLVIFTVAFSTMVALLATAIQLYVDYRRELGQIEQTFEQIKSSHLPTIASALWATNQQELQIALDGMSRLPDVQYVVVTENDKVWASAGDNKHVSVKSREYVVSYKHREKFETIGNLNVVIDLEGIYQRLIDKFWVILITNGAKTFLVSGFMFWLFYHLVTRHLKHIAAFAARLGIKNLDQRLKLTRQASSRADEFDLVLDGMDRMQTNLKQAMLELELSASVFKHSHQGIMITEADGTIVDVNPAFRTITGYSKNEVIGENPRILRSGRHDEVWYNRMWLKLSNTGHWSGEIWNRRKNGEIYPEMEVISAVYDDDGRLINYVSVFSDISQQKQHETELNRIAHYDQLTNLPNRRLLIDRLNQAMPRARRENKHLAVCYVDLDGFKPINDRYGHSVGDHLLIEISQRLRETLRESDTLARLGGDEFVILLGEIDHAEDCIHSVERSLNAIATQTVINDVPIEITASIGVTLYPLDDANSDTLLRHADRAMYTAKQAGKNCYHLFDPQLDKEEQDFQTQVISLAEAINTNQFVLYYQPKVNLFTGALLGCEALIRWQHPDHGLLSPASFLPMLEKHALEIELGNWVIDSTLKQIEIWQQIDFNFICSVNISAHHLLHPSFVGHLTYLLEKYPSVPASKLELEVLETVAMSDLTRAIEVMTDCKVLGVHLSLDDFGTGYSSLAYFRHLPVDTLKIDKSFTHDMLIDKEGMALVESVVRLAELFERTTIAEGVETREQMEALIGLGCHYAQGYYIARPMPAEDLLQWHKSWLVNKTWQKQHM